MKGLSGEVESLRGGSSGVLLFGLGEKTGCLVIDDHDGS
jgi:hypothetical protein